MEKNGGETCENCIEENIGKINANPRISSIRIPAQSSREDFSPLMCKAHYLATPDAGSFSYIIPLCVRVHKQECRLPRHFGL